MKDIFVVYYLWSKLQSFAGKTQFVVGVGNDRSLMSKGVFRDSYYFCHSYVICAIDHKSVTILNVTKIKSSDMGV